MFRILKIFAQRKFVLNVILNVPTFQGTIKETQLQLLKEVTKSLGNIHFTNRFYK